MEGSGRERGLGWRSGGGGGRRGERTLAFFFEGEFALFVVVLVFATTPVFTSLDVLCELGSCRTSMSRRCSGKVRC